MSTMTALLIVLSTACVPLGLVWAVINLIRKKPVKKALMLSGISAVVFLAVFILYDTSGEPNGREENQTASVTNTGDPSAGGAANDTPSEPQQDTASEPKPDTEPDDDAEYLGADLWLDDYTYFTEGRAWVQFQESHRGKGSVAASEDAWDAALGGAAEQFLHGAMTYNPEGNNRAALIDTNGKILWESGLTENSVVLTEKSEFRDGLAYCVFNGNEASMYCIIDSDGNVTYTREKDENYLILDHGGGLFLVAEHILSFDANEWRIGAIDKNGNTVVPFQVYEKTPPPGPDPVEAPSGEAPDPNVDYWGYLDYQEQLRAYEEYVNYSYPPEALSFDVDDPYSGVDYSHCEYLGDNIYQISGADGSWYVLLNIDTQRVIFTYDIDYEYKYETDTGTINFISAFENGAATVLHDDGVKAVVCTLTTDGVLTPIVDNRWTDDVLSYAIRTESGRFSDGLMYLSSSPIEELFPSGAYYNLEGECVLDFPEYRDKYRYSCGSFYNGYAVMNIRGADGNWYITAIDKEGSLLFEPQPGYYTAAGVDGKHILALQEGCVAVFDMQWNPLYRVECGCISMLDLQNVCEVNEGMLRIKDVFINLETGTIIGLHDDIYSEMRITSYLH